MREYKVCKGCGKNKHISNYWKHPASIDRLQYKCIDCLTTERSGNKRPPLSRDAMELLFSMLNNFSSNSENKYWIDGEIMCMLNPSMKIVFNLKKLGVIEQYGEGYQFTEDGMTVAKGVEALLKLELKQHEV